MLYVRETHRVVGAHAAAFEATIRDDWVPALAAGGARLLWYLDHAHGTGPAYTVVIPTMVAGGGALERLARRVHDGDLSRLARHTDRLREGADGRVLTEVSWSPPAGDPESLPGGGSHPQVVLLPVGGTVGLFVKLAAGTTTVVLPRFEAGLWLETVARHRVRQTWLVPTMLRRILDHPALPRTDLSCLQALHYGGAPCPPAVIDDALEALPHVEFTNTFGQTETLGAYAALGPEDHRDPHRRRSAGRPLPGVEVEIRDPDTGDPVPAGESGEIHVRAAHQAADGWLATGDLARRDDDGYLFLTGRRGELINRGGGKLAPGPVEDALRAHYSRRFAPFKVPDVIVRTGGLPYTVLGELRRGAVAERLRGSTEEG